MEARRSRRHVKVLSPMRCGSAMTPGASCAAGPVRISSNPDMRILVTRPSPDGERTAAGLRARGHDVVLAPLLTVERLPDAPLGPGPWAAVLLTSANAARAVAVHLRRDELLPLPVLAVGRHSAEA